MLKPGICYKIMPLILLIVLQAEGFAQTAVKHAADSSRFRVNRFTFKTEAVPAALVITGLALTGQHTKTDLQARFPRTDTRIDNYLQWSPEVVMFAADVFTDRHRNNVFNQTKYLCISLLATGLITQVLKLSTQVTRPNGGNLSFPSGHTSNAFTGAAVLYHEYIDSSPLLAYSGFLMSTTTGVLRITNNRHWVPDVLVGAGIGILVTDLVYRLEPLKNWDPFHLSEKENISFIPQIDPVTKFCTFTLSIKL
jgi:membrane-associated phospholipid phosphatase